MSRNLHEIEIQQFDDVIYDLFTGELVDTISMFDMIEEFEESLEGMQIRIRGPIAYKRASGDLYFEWTLMNNMWEFETIFKYIRMNYSTGEFSLHDNSILPIYPSTENERGLTVQMSFFRRWWVDDDYTCFYLNNGLIIDEYSDFRIIYSIFTPTIVFPSIVMITLSPDNLPLESESLYTRFPELRQYQGLDGYEINVVLTGYPTAEEIFKLFMEDGHEIVFEDLIMRGDLSIDGEYHEIHSFEDYFRFRDTSEWEEE